MTTSTSPHIEDEEEESESIETGSTSINMEIPDPIGPEWDTSELGSSPETESSCTPIPEQARLVLGGLGKSEWNGSINNEYYLTFCVTRIQAWWRCCVSALKYNVVKMAAKRINVAWRRYMISPRCVKSRRAWKKAQEEKRQMQLNPDLKFINIGSKRSCINISLIRAVQRCWRGSKDRKIFRKYRQIILNHELSPPKALLKCLSCSEADLAEPAAGLHVRFRLGGHVFPPIMLYKVYTHRPIVDMGAFSPRQYTLEKKTYNFANSLKSEKRYVRWENNGWRLVTAALWLHPDVLPIESPEMAPFHFSPRVRKEEKVLAAKQKRREWLMKLYSEGKAATLTLERATDAGPSDAMDVEPKEEELITWLSKLDYDSYEKDWFKLAASFGRDATNIPRQAPANSCKVIMIY